MARQAISVLRRFIFMAKWSECIPLVVLVDGMVSFGWEQWSDREAQPPVWTAGRSLRVIARAKLQAQRQASYFQDLRHHEIDRHCPMSVLPIVSGLCVDGKTPAKGQHY